MRSVMIEGATRKIGKSQGYLELAVRDIVINDSVSGEGTPAMLTAWEPMPDEIDRICAGAPIILEILGRNHPPVMLTAADPQPVLRAHKRCFFDVLATMLPLCVSFLPAQIRIIGSRSATRAGVIRFVLECDDWPETTEDRQGSMIISDAPGGRTARFAFVEVAANG